MRLMKLHPRNSAAAPPIDTVEEKAEDLVIILLLDNIILGFGKMLEGPKN